MTHAADDPFTDWDAAYVLGALDAGERRAFEEHLVTCSRCRQAIDELRGLPNLLGTVPESAYLDVPESAYLDVPQSAYLDGLAPSAGPVPDSLLPRLLAAAADTDGAPQDSVSSAETAPAGELDAAPPPRRLTVVGGRRRRRWIVSSLAAAAAVVALVATASIAYHNGSTAHPPNQHAVAMTQLIPGPVQATAKVTATSGGSTVWLWCKYEAESYSAGDYGLVVHSSDNQSQRLATWPGVPGQTMVLQAPTTWNRAQITSVQVIGPSGRALLTMTPNA
jgi:hypothetical protein